MYHKVSPGIEDNLTIDPYKLAAQWQWLQQEGYSTLSLPQYIDIASGKRQTYPEKAILITFDDGYLNNQLYAYPLLQKLGWQATFFIIADVVEGTREPEHTIQDVKMTTDQLRMLDPATVQLALHGYRHEHFGHLPVDEIVQVLSTSIAIFDKSGLPYHKALAYPYGARPKGEMLMQLKKEMAAMGITAAFRIGNQVSKVPSPDIYEIKRIDICGTDTLEQFKIKLRKGKLKPF